MTKPKILLAALAVGFPFLASVPALALDDAIQADKDGKTWTITTQSSACRLNVSANGAVNAVCYGSRAMLENTIKATAPEIPVRGGAVAGLPLLEAVFPDGVRAVELVFKSGEIIQIDGRPALKIVQRDKFYPLEISSFIRVLHEYDIIEKWVEVRNTGHEGQGAIKIENLQSGAISLPVDSYELTHFSGAWGNELRPYATKLTPGVKTIQTRDFKSYGSSSFIVRPENETGKTSGKAWFGSVCHSGNWRVDFEKLLPNRPWMADWASLQIIGGMNFWDQDISLKPGQSFTTPRIIFGYTEDGVEGVTLRLTSCIREQLLPATHRDKPRPVMFNSWFVTKRNVNEQQQLALAKQAAELGVEMFVIDSGWYERGANLAGVGDWKVDHDRFPHGLKWLADNIKTLGMDFGIWIEPEAVHTSSELYQAHPDWAFHYPNRQRRDGRVMLNLAREDVYQYLYKTIHDLIAQSQVKFIKWDHNIHLINPGPDPAAATDEQRAVRIRYMENLHRLLSALRADFPDVWFENCSSGAGRLDMEMSRYFDMNWASDNTDPVDRLFIHDSYLTLFPANTLVSWVTAEDWHAQNLPLAFKFDISMAGVLGLSIDINKFTDREKQTAKNKIALYKEIRDTVQKGDLHRLLSPFETNRGILQYVSSDKKHSVLFYYRLAEYPENATPETRQTPLVKLRGLDPGAKYRIDKLKLPAPLTGKYLMEAGLRLPLKGAFTSDIYKIESID